MAIHTRDVNESRSRQVSKKILGLEKKNSPWEISRPEILSSYFYSSFINKFSNNKQLQICLPSRDGRCSWLCAIVTLNMQAPPSIQRPGGCSAHSLRCQSHHNHNLAAEEKVLSVSWWVGSCRRCCEIVWIIQNYVLWFICALKSVRRGDFPTANSKHPSAHRPAGIEGRACILSVTSAVFTCLLSP